MTIKFTNNAETLLSTSSLGTGDTSVAVDDGSVFPALSAGEFFYATLIRADAVTTREIVKVTARSGNTLTIVRAQDNTSALTFSADDLIELRIIAASLLALKAADELTTGDAAVILSTSAGNITIDAQGNDTDIILKGTDGSSDTTFLTIDGSDAGKATFNNEIVSGAVITSGAGLVIANAGNIGSASDTDAIAIASNGVVTFSQIPVLPADTIDSDHYVDGSIDTAHIADNQVTLAKMAGLARGKIIYGDSSGDPAALAVGSANYVLTSDGTDISWAASTGADPSSADGDSLGTASAEWSDLYLADGGVIYFGNDQDTTLTHTDGTGLTLNSTNKLCFNDATQFIQGASGTILDIAATDEIELTATLIDVNGNLDVSGTYTGGGLMTTGGNIVIPDGGEIGTATTTNAIDILATGEIGLGGNNGWTGAQLYVYDSSTTRIGLRVVLDNASSAKPAIHATTDGTYFAAHFARFDTTTANPTVYSSNAAAGSAFQGASAGHTFYGTTSSASHAAFFGQASVTSHYALIGYSTHGCYATSVYCVGVMYAGTKPFRITHGLREGYDLIHMGVEAPQADLIYRGKVDLVDGQASIDMDTHYGMTQGTFVWLTKSDSVQTFTSNETGWDAVRSSFSGDTITIECQNASSTDTISWMVIAERGDPHIRESEVTDDDGNMILERESEPEPPLPPPPLDL